MRLEDAKRCRSIKDGDRQKASMLNNGYRDKVEDSSNANALAPFAAEYPQLAGPSLSLSTGGCSIPCGLAYLSL